MEKFEYEKDKLAGQEEELFGDTKKTEKSDLSVEELMEKYKCKNSGGKIYAVTGTIYVDDETEDILTFLFKKPNTASYDRYVKTSSASSTKALKTFVLDNVVLEQAEELRDTFEEYPAFAISLGEKLLAMLGLAKDTSVKKL